MQIALKEKLRLGGAPETEAERNAVRQVKLVLNRLGYYAPEAAAGMTGEIDPNFKDALYAFQRKSAIYFDDVEVSPGSTTERMLNQDLAKEDEGALYIWHTVGDGKVRGEHAAREGHRYSRDNPPDGENPGEDYNCRCWAEPVVAPYHPWIEWVRKRREERVGRNAALEKFDQPFGVNTDLMTPVPIDAINPTWSPFDFLTPGVGLAGRMSAREAVPIARATVQAAKELPTELAAKLRDTSWIRNTPTAQF